MTSPSRGRRGYAHGRKIHHIRFCMDGTAACHLFFIKTKSMKLRQAQQLAMQQAAGKRQQPPATQPAQTEGTGKEEAKEGEDDSTLLNSHLQQLYQQGRLGDNPYILQPPPPPPPPAPRRFTRPPQPITANIPALRIDPGPFQDLLDEQAVKQQQAGQLHSRVSQGRLVPLFDRDCVWYLWPHELSREAELSKKGSEDETEPSTGMVGSAAEALVRSRTIKAK